MSDKIIQDILAWAHSQPQIKVIILEGSMGSETAKDVYSDYDINLFVEDTEPFLESDEWFKQFGEILVFQKEGTHYKDAFITTRLVIYENSRRVDFSFWPIWVLVDWIASEELPEFYKNGYKILLDKFGFANQLPKPTFAGYEIRKPSKNEFLQNIYNFYFEAAIIAKYLYRDNLWFAIKLSNGPIKDFLQQMIMWQTAGNENWNLKEMSSLGKNLEEKISQNITEKFKKTFSAYDSNECWQSLFFMIEFFGQISKELSQKLEIDFPEEKVEKIMDYINKIYTNN